jgi:hypothetical protein
LGASTVTTDGHRGFVAALVLDPHTRTVTHLAVTPPHQRHQARLVPTAIATAEPTGDVRLACDHHGFEALEPLEHFDVVDAGPFEAYGPYGFGEAEIMGATGLLTVWTDRLPDGEAALRRGTPVRAGDATIGHIDGLLVDAENRVTAVLVAAGRVWSHRTIAVPVDAVERVDTGGLTITATWDENHSA